MKSVQRFVFMAFSCLLINLLLPSFLFAQEFRLPAAVRAKIQNVPDFKVVGTAVTTPAVSRPELAELKLKPGQFIETRVKPTSIERANKLFKTTGTQYAGPNASGRYVRFEPVVVLDQDEGMRLGPDGKTFSASINVGLLDLDSEQSTAVPQGTSIQLSSNVATIDRTLLRFTHTNSPYSEVVLKSQAPGDEVSLTLMPSFSHDTPSVKIPVFRPKVVLSGIPNRMEGLGAGKSTITVSISEDGGTVPRTVILSGQGVTVGQNSVQVGGTKAATVEIKSSGLGTGTIVATSPGLVEARNTVRLGFPLYFLIAALAGGVIGALALNFKGRRTTSSLRRIIYGVLIGFLMAGLYVLGANLGLPFPYQDSPLAVLVVAALGALGIINIPGMVKKS